MNEHHTDPAPAFTRRDYLAAPLDQQRAAHRRYYGQFVTPAVRAVVARAIGVERLRASTDPRFNDIHLHRWDALEPIIRDLCLSKMGDVNGRITAGGRRGVAWSLSDAVCIAKEAARQIVEGTHDENQHHHEDER